MMMNEGSFLPREKALINDEFLAKMDEVFFLLGAFYIGDYVPWLGGFDPQGLKKRINDTLKVCNAVWQTIVDDHKMKLEAASKAQSEGTSATDTIHNIVDVLLTRSGDNGQHMEDTKNKVLLGALQIPHVAESAIAYDNCLIVRSMLKSLIPAMTNDDIERHVKAYSHPGAIGSRLALFAWMLLTRLGVQCLTLSMYLRFSSRNYIEPDSVLFDQSSMVVEYLVQLKGQDESEVDTTKNYSKLFGHLAC